MKENLPNFVCSSSLVEAFCIYANNQMTKRLAGAGMLPENVEIHFFSQRGVAEESNTCVHNGNKLFIWYL